MNTAATSADLRENNRSRALALVHQSIDGLTRVELAEQLDVTRTTAAALVADLIALSLIQEREADPTGRRGRPTTRISANPEGPVVLAVEVALNSITLTEVTIGGALQNTRSHHIDSSNPDEVIDRLNELLVARRQSLQYKCAGIGVAMHGLVDDGTGRVVQAPNLDWNNVELGQRLRVAHDLPVVVGNDASLGAIVEAKRGAGRDAHTMLYVKSTIGVGGGFIFDGRPAPSRRGWHGEIGHLPFGDPAYRCRCGAYGCWETVVNETALAVAAGLDVSHRHGSELTAGIFARAAEGDPISAKAVGTICESLGSGLGSLINVLDPDVIVLAGFVRQLYESDPESTIAALKSATMNAHRDTLPPVRSGAISDPALAGAAEAILAKLILAPTEFLSP